MIGFSRGGNRTKLVTTLSAQPSGTGTIVPGVIPGDMPKGLSSALNEISPRLLGYDAAGRLSYDNNLGVKAIRYNLLGLPHTLSPAIRKTSRPTSCGTTLPTVMRLTV